jgi:hypothetical protein
MGGILCLWILIQCFILMSVVALHLIFFLIGVGQLVLGIRKVRACLERRKSHVLGEGDVDLLKYLDLAMAYNCCAVIEVKTVDGLRRQSVGWLKAKG